MNQNDPRAELPKKPYYSPTLKTYGTVRALTQNLGKSGKNDGQATGKTRTGI